MIWGEGIRKTNGLAFFQFNINIQFINNAIIFVQHGKMVSTRIQARNGLVKSISFATIHNLICPFCVAPNPKPDFALQGTNRTFNGIANSWFIQGEIRNNNLLSFGIAPRGVNG